MSTVSRCTVFNKAKGIVFCSLDNTPNMRLCVRLFVVLALLPALTSVTRVLGLGLGLGRSNISNGTRCDERLCTWWHDTGEINTATPVSAGGVRQSRRYVVHVGLAGTDTFTASFVYESMPRNGNGRIYAPWDAPNSNTLPMGVHDGVFKGGPVKHTLCIPSLHFHNDLRCVLHSAPSGAVQNMSRILPN